MDRKNSDLIVTIDGPAGAGKSTIAKIVAKKLGFTYIDSGAMYRALTLKVMMDGIDFSDVDRIVEVADGIEIMLEGTKVFLDREDVSEKIRTIEVTNNIHFIADDGRIRGPVVRKQQEMGRNGRVVMEGRDIGTVVFPHARYKFYLDASVEERLYRRAKELEKKGIDFDREKLREDIIRRDNFDKSREVGPLKIAEGAIVVDTTNMTIDEVADFVAKSIIVGKNWTNFGADIR